MNEDAGCNNPCGAEPMGCATCDLFRCTLEDDDWFEEPELIASYWCCECGYDWTSNHGHDFCPKCKSTDLDYEYE